MNELPSIRDVIARYGLDARKSLGQHFLLDTSLLHRIVQQAGNLQGIHAIEIGPGPGGLTRALLNSAAVSVTVIEKDVRCVEALALLKDAYGERLHIIDGDAMQTDVTALTPAPRAVIANLPYNVGTELLLQWLDAIAADAGAFTHLTLMFQREVAERITASPNSKAYGRLSVYSQWLCEAHRMMDIPPGAFSPPPKVVSSVIRLTPRAKPLAHANKTALEKVLLAAFGQRRKMLRSALGTLGVNTAQLLENAGIDGTRRAETLSVEQFCALARAFSTCQPGVGRDNTITTPR